MKQKDMEQVILAEYRSMYKFAFTFVKNEDDAMDVVQDSVVKAMQKCDRLRKEETVKSWLMSIVANTARDFLRKQKHVDGSGEIPESGAEDKYEDADLYEALKTLDDRERTVVVLRFFEDMPLQEIADSMGLNLNSLKSILYRALAKLKIQIQEGETA